MASRPSCCGAVGSVVATGGPAIRVSAPDHRIALRNILIAPLPGTVSTNGIELLAYSALIIEDSVIASLAGTCVYATGSGRIRIDNSTLRNCYGGGITLEANANGEVSRSKILYADVATPTPSTGVRVVATANQRTRLTLSGSIVSGWSTGVLSTASGHDGIAYAIVARSTIQGAVTGLLASSTIDASGVIAISGSTVSDNNFGWQINGSNAAIRSRQDNTFEWNGPNTGLLTTVALE